jgi:hypothetical protein
MSSPRDFVLTKHAIDRLRERCPAFAKEVDWIKETALKKRATYDFFAQASEEKSFLNNSIFITMLGEKYGFENRYSMFVHDNMVFVGVSNVRGNYIVTVLNKNEHYVPHVRNSVKKFIKRPILIS